MGSGVRVELGLGDGRVLVVRLVVGIEDKGGLEMSWMLVVLPINNLMN